MLFVVVPVRCPFPSAVIWVTLAAGTPEPSRPEPRMPYTPLRVAFVHVAANELAVIRATKSKTATVTLVEFMGPPSGWLKSFRA
jgi:hypothetical protein